MENKGATLDAQNRPVKVRGSPRWVQAQGGSTGTRCSLTIEEVDASPPSAIELGFLRVRSQQLGGLWYCGNEPLNPTSRVAVRRLCGRGSGGTVPRYLKRWKSD